MRNPFVRRAAPPPAKPAKPVPLVYNPHAVISTGAGLAVTRDTDGNGYITFSIWRVVNGFCVASGFTVARDALLFLQGYTYAVQYLETAGVGQSGRVPPASP